MSMPSYSILCTRCDYESSGRAIWGPYYYKDDEGRFNLERQLGWCNGCQRIAAIEDFDDVAKAAGKIRADLYYIHRDTDTVFANILNSLFPSRRKWLKDRIDTVNKNAKYIQLAEKRVGQERCLTCGSHVVQPYKPIREGGGFKETGDFMLHGQHGTDVEHPGCGGVFYEKADDVRLHGKFDSKFYTTDGDFIESCLEKTKY